MGKPDRFIEELIKDRKEQEKKPSQYIEDLLREDSGRGLEEPRVEKPKAPKGPRKPLVDSEKLGEFFEKHRQHLLAAVVVVFVGVVVYLISQLGFGGPDPVVSALSSAAVARSAGMDELFSAGTLMNAGEYSECRVHLANALSNFTAAKKALRNYSEDPNVSKVVSNLNDLITATSAIESLSFVKEYAEEALAEVLPGVNRDDCEAIAEALPEAFSKLEDAETYLEEIEVKDYPGTDLTSDSVRKYGDYTLPVLEYRFKILECRSILCGHEDDVEKVCEVIRCSDAFYPELKKLIQDFLSDPAYSKDTDITEEDLDDVVSSMNVNQETYETYCSS